ncbi:2Fe-2S iron-sulfur cluster binding domain-containing protein [Streptomyces bambusae]|uniref:2Fe-2S iron-sulfur cluster binding domain-containing protein n=1 Tax=Streptomyces bambusae TaxID=1550616 RepID=A0ABS6Z645_9ACTN|nr:2Fe-2S iron-sulfur cluster binding domain-containing protein [Streptomyces bambusae]
MAHPIERTRSRVRLQVNGERYEGELDHRVTLLDLLREHLGLTGAKKGCDHGQCGACTVLVDGRRANSCLLLAVAQDGADVTTVEGLGPAGPNPLQEAFLERDAFQCGYCTPGQLCSATGLLAEAAAAPGSADLSRAGIAEGMSGNLCRCGAYPRIVDAVRDVVAARENAAPGGAVRGGAVRGEAVHGEAVHGEAVHGEAVRGEVGA